MDKHTYIISVQKNVQGLICCGYIEGILKKHDINYKESNKRGFFYFSFSINHPEDGWVVLKTLNQLKQLLGSIKDKLGGLLWRSIIW